MVNSRKIKAKIIEKGTTIQKLAPKIKYSAYTLGRMISNKSKMNLEVSEFLIKELDIRDEDIKDFFYI